MIPRGWQLVPIEPTDRMLGEFAGCYWPHLGREKQAHERAAYAAMLNVCPSPPIDGAAELESLREQVMRLTSELRLANIQVTRAKGAAAKAHNLLGAERKRKKT